jgi:hypothetical protein
MRLPSSYIFLLNYEGSGSYAAFLDYPDIVYPWMWGQKIDPGNRINHLNFLIILLDKDFFACYKLKSFNTKEVGNLNIMPFFIENVVKTKKEDGMKKLVIAVIAVLLALPVVSFAGSATSMWDLTIGGYIAVIGQVSDQETAMWGVATNASRRSGSAENRTDKFGTFAAQIDPRITFNIKGPDMFGAKSSATVQWDFSGMGGATNVGADNGEAKIRYAKMQFDWANDTILFGNWVWNYRDGAGGEPAPGVGTLIALPGQFGAPRETQLRWQHNFNKNFSTKLALVYPTLEGWKLDGFGGNTGAANANSDYMRSKWPFISGMVRYNSDACGKIGNFNLVAGMSGVYGRKSVMRDAGAATRYRYSQKQLDGWLGEAFFMIPIIPERPNNKAGALLFYTNAMAGQGLTPYSAQLFPAAYRRNTTAVADSDNYSAPRGYAWEVGTMVWLHDKVWLSPSYNDMFTQGSRFWKAANPTAAYRTQNYNIFLAYAPTPALTMGIEYTRIVTNYNVTQNMWTNGTGFKKSGVANAVRFGAYYWF